MSDRYGGQDPVRRRWSPLDLESSGGVAAPVGDQAGTDGRIGGLLSCGRASGQDRGLAAALDGSGASTLDRSPETTAAQGEARRGASGDRRTVWPPREPGLETGARLLPAECQ